MSYHSQQQQQQQRQYGATTNASISVLANVADHQEKQYKRRIEQNETMGMGIAMRLAKGEQFEELFGTEFTGECREKLKVLARENVTKERQLKAYVSAIRVVIETATTTAMNATNTNNNNNNENNENQDPEHSNTTTTDTSNNNNNNSNEFKEQMETEFAKALQSIERDSVTITQEPSYLGLCKQLGDFDHQNKQDEDEDDELAVVHNTDETNANNTNKFKCPLTMTYFDDPVRSKVCKHSFSRNAIYEHLRRSKKCPVPGCVNSSMGMAELEDDFETKMRVHRFKKRESASKRVAQSARIFDDDDDENEQAEEEFE